MYQCSYCNYESIYKYNVQRHEHVHTQSKHEIGSNIQQNLSEASSNIQNQHNSQYGSGSTHIPIEKHNEAIEDYREVVGIAHKWKKECEKMQEAYQLLEEHRREDGENSHAIITYLQNVLNANNIRYNLELA